MRRILHLFSIILIISFIAGCCAKKTGKCDSKDTVMKSVILNKNYSLPAEFDYIIERASITDSILSIDVKYFDGNGEHKFDLLFNGNYAKSMPPIAGFYLNHTSTGENGDKEITETLKFNIAPAKYNSGNSMYVKISNYSEKLKYEY